MNRKGLLLLLIGLLTGLLLGAVILLSSPSPSSGAGRSLPPTVGTAVRDFELPLLAGGTQRLEDLKGKPVLINFWATWCLPCKEEMPLLEKTASQYDGRLVVIGVDYGETEEQVQAFVDEMGIHFPILLDKAGIVSDMYFVRNFPTTFFIDSVGVLRAHHLGLLTDDRLPVYLKLIGINQ